MIAATMSMRRQFPRTLPPRTLDQPLRSSVLGKSAAVALRDAPETQRAPAESEDVAAPKSRTSRQLRIPPHQTVKVIPTAAVALCWNCDGDPVAGACQSLPLVGGQCAA